MCQGAESPHQPSPQSVPEERTQSQQLEFGRNDFEDKLGTVSAAFIGIVKSYLVIFLSRSSNLAVIYNMTPPLRLRKYYSTDFSIETKILPNLEDSPQTPIRLLYFPIRGPISKCLRLGQCSMLALQIFPKSIIM